MRVRSHRPASPFISILTIRSQRLNPMFSISGVAFIQRPTFFPRSL